MNLVIVKDYQAVSKAAAKLLAEYVGNNPKSCVCLPTGGSVEGVYQELTERIRLKNISFADITVFNMDEYATLSKDDPNSYYYFLKKHLYDKIDIKSENANALTADGSDLQKACQEYTKSIEAAGGFDFTLLGIGSDGHIAFNMPGDTYHMDTHLVDLSAETIQANSRFFDDISQVPKQAITIGVGTIMKSKKIALVANGKAKAKALAAWLNNRVIDPKLPASILWLHQDLTIIIDEEAASELTCSQSAEQCTCELRISA